MITQEIINNVWEQTGDFLKGQRWSCCTPGERTTMMESVLKVCGDVAATEADYDCRDSLMCFIDEALKRGYVPYRQIHFSQFVGFAIEYFSDEMEAAMFSAVGDDGQIPHEAL